MGEYKGLKDLLRGKANFYVIQEVEKFLEEHSEDMKKAADEGYYRTNIRLEGLTKKEKEVYRGLLFNNHFFYITGGITCAFHTHEVDSYVMHLDWSGSND